MKKIFKTAICIFSAVFMIMSVPMIAHAELLNVENPSAVSYYNMIPDNVKLKLNSRGVNIVVNSDAVYMNTGCPTTVGVTVSSVYRDGRISFQQIYVKNGYEDAILHEVGHFMESYPNRYKYWTDTPGWYAIYSSELNNGVAAGMDSANVYNQDEYFAEGFALYVTNPVALATYCPLTFQYINALVTAP